MGVTGRRMYGIRRTISVAAEARNHRIPSIAGIKAWADDGALISYEPNVHDMFRRAAIYVDRDHAPVAPAARRSADPVRVPRQLFGVPVAGRLCRLHRVAGTSRVGSPQDQAESSELVTTWWPQRATQPSGRSALIPVRRRSPSRLEVHIPASGNNPAVRVECRWGLPPARSRRGADSARLPPSL